MERLDGVAYREEGPSDGPVALMLHGFPESSYLWRDALPVAAEAGYRALAPDFPGFGDSPPDLPGTWEHQIENLEAFRRGLGIERAVLVMHDWGGLIGMRWACDHPDAVAGMVISNTGFFSDGQWHGMADVMRTEGQGEEMMDNMSQELLAGVLQQSSPAFDDAAVAEYWKTFAEPDRRQSVLDLYRSGDFDKLEPYEGRLAGIDAPALILWGQDDQFAPVGGAHRLHKELPRSELVVLDGVGHFAWEEDPESSGGALRSFLEGLA